jgi:hypothetical protein
MSGLIYRFDFTKPLLLVNTPAEWLLPEPYKFDINLDTDNIIKTVGKSYPLFKFVNTIVEPKIHFNEFKNKSCKDVHNIIIKIQITLFKNETVSTDLTPLEKEIKLSLPTIAESYSNIMSLSSNIENSTNSALFYQYIYFPMMLEMGFADEQKYEVDTKAFDAKHNHA